MTDFPRFVAAIEQLGTDEKARADALAVSSKSLSRYRRGQFPKALKGLVQRPDVLRALAEDVEASKQATSEAA